MNVWCESDRLRMSVLSERRGEPGRQPARPARTQVKALHVPTRIVSNSLFRKRFGTAETSHVGDIDSIVLQVCYAIVRYRRLASDDSEVGAVNRTSFRDAPSLSADHPSNFSINFTVPERHCQSIHPRLRKRLRRRPANSQG